MSGVEGHYEALLFFKKKKKTKPNKNRKLDLFNVLGSFTLCAFMFGLHRCMCTMCTPSALGNHQRALDALELELQMILSYYVTFAKVSTKQQCGLDQVAGFRWTALESAAELWVWVFFYFSST